MKPKFITCNYTNLCGTKLNGRLNRDQVYMYSLRGIAECGDTIINYTCPYNMAFVDPFLKENNIKNVISVDYDLTKSPYHARVDAIKDTHPFFYNDTSWLNRCVEIMWGKFLWMEDNLQTLEDDDYLFWIDAGLSQGCVIPRKFNRFHNNKRFYREDQPADMLLEFAHMHGDIFDDKFSAKLENFAGEEILLICNQNSQHGDKLPSQWKFSTYSKLFPIGGLFGGKKKVLVPFINAFKTAADEVLDASLLVKEEQIMAYLLDQHREWFQIFTFTTWYHDDWIPYGVFDPNTMVSFSKFFEVL